MSVKELKQAIVQKVELIDNEKALKEILALLNSAPTEEKKIDATKHMEQLFSENDGLLKRLA